MSHTIVEKTTSARQHSTQQLLNDFVNDSDVGLAIYDRELRYRAVNRWLAATHRISTELHVGKCLRDVLGEIAFQVEPAVKEVFGSGRPLLNLEVKGTLPNSREQKHWIRHFFPMKDANGHVKQVAGIVVELTPGLATSDQRQSRRGARESPDIDLLRSWKEIAGYLGTCVRTAQRWEQEHGLPVRRVRASKGAVVFASPSDIVSWMRTHSGKNDQ